MSPHRDKDDASGASLRPVKAVLLAALGILLAYAGLSVLLRVPQLPYNVRELFPVEHRRGYMLAFSMLLVWAGFAPAWVAHFLITRPRWLIALPVWTALIGLGSWVPLRFSVTRESLYDILGWQALRWGGDWEMMGRFLALQAVVTVPLIVAGVSVGGAVRLGWRAGLRRAAWAALSALPWLALGGLVVGEWASTDNLTELVRTEPFKLAGPLALLGLVALLALNVAALSSVLAGRGPGRKIAALIATGLLVLPGWGLLYLGLNPHVHKYGSVFPAIRFLLGPDRATAMPWGVLFFRWCIVQLAGVLMLALGGLAGLLLRPRRAQGGLAPGSETAPQVTCPGRPGRGHLLFAIAYGAFLVYGSLIPFDFHPVPFGRAWDAFWHSGVLVEAQWGLADVVTNTAMFIPLTFAALGAWSRENTRPGNWLRAPAVFLIALAFSAALEFSQLFFHRISSVHDIIAQAIGSAIGLLGWLAFGPATARRLRAALPRPAGSPWWTWVLGLHAAVLAMVELFPMDMSISVGRLYRRYYRGLVHLVPFADFAVGSLPALLLRMAAFVPVGALAAILAGKPRARRWRAFLYAGGCVLGLEILQALVQSRMATSTDVVVGLVGVAVGLVLYRSPGNEGSAPHRR